MSPCHRCGAALPADARFCVSCGVPRGVDSDRLSVRKHVVVLFVDIVASTSLGEQLDPEPLRHVLQRYFEAVSRVLWAHGATVEKFIGDAVMAVFGVPVAGENDAEQALAAAAELHAAALQLSAELERDYRRDLRLRIGVNGGDVFVTRHADGQYAVTGDVVNVAARLEQHAEPGQTLVGGTVASLAGPGAPLAPATPITVRGRGRTAPPSWAGRTSSPTCTALPAGPRHSRTAGS